MCVGEASDTLYFQPLRNAQTAQVILALIIKPWGCCLLGQCLIITSLCLKICHCWNKTARTLRVMRWGASICLKSREIGLVRYFHWLLHVLTADLQRLSQASPATGPLLLGGWTLLGCSKVAHNFLWDCSFLAANQIQQIAWFPWPFSIKNIPNQYLRNMLSKIWSFFSIIFASSPCVLHSRATLFQNMINLVHIGSHR